MSTQCAIGSEEDGMFRYVTSDVDRYLTYTGAMLCDAYDSIERVRALISMGGLEVIGLKISLDPSSPHGKDIRQEHVCVFHKRNLKERGYNASAVDLQGFSKIVDEFPYVYRYDGKHWKCS